MNKHTVFAKREHALEEVYFRAQDAHLLAALRTRATFGELAAALKEKLAVDDPELLQRISALGLTADTGAALLLSPLVEVAWADGEVTKHGWDIVLDIAQLRGVEPRTPAYATLVNWLTTRPSDELFRVGLETLRTGLSVLTPPEQDERVHQIVWACKRVAMSPPAFLGAFGAPWEISHRKADLIERIGAELRRTGA